MQDKILELFKEHLSLEERQLVEDHLDDLMRTGIKPCSYGKGHFFWQFNGPDGKTYTLNNMQYKYYLHLANNCILDKISIIKKSLNKE
jgi:hypothetical protein